MKQRNTREKGRAAAVAGLRNYETAINIFNITYAKIDAFDISNNILYLNNASYVHFKCLSNTSIVHS